MSEEEKKIHMPYIVKDTIHLKSMQDGKIYNSKSEYYESLKKGGKVIADNDYIKDVQKNAQEIKNKEDKLRTDYLRDVYDARTNSNDERQYQGNLERLDRQYQERYRRDFKERERDREYARELQERRAFEERKK